MALGLLRLDECLRPLSKISFDKVLIRLGRPLKKAYPNAKVGIHRAEKGNLSDSKANLSGYSKTDYTYKGKVDIPFKDKDIIHFLETFASRGKFNLNANVEGRNDHHKVETCFKALAKALHDATRIVHGDVPSTKGVV